jgi:hypothetical protein
MRSPRGLLVSLLPVPETPPRLRPHLHSRLPFSLAEDSTTLTGGWCLVYDMSVSFVLMFWDPSTTFTHTDGLEVVKMVRCSFAAGMNPECNTQ